MWLHGSVGRASHRYRGGHSSKPVEALIFFFGLLLFNCLNWKYTAMIILHFHLQPQFVYTLHQKYVISHPDQTGLARSRIKTSRNERSRRNRLAYTLLCDDVICFRPAKKSHAVYIGTAFSQNPFFNRDFQVGGLTRTRKREPTRGVRGHAPPGKFEILFF